VLQALGNRGQKSGVRNQGSERPSAFWLSDPCPLNPDAERPQHLPVLPHPTKQFPHSAIDKPRHPLLTSRAARPKAVFGTSRPASIVP